MTDDVLITVGVVISVIIIFELIVATILLVKYTKKRYGWFNCKCCCCCCRHCHVNSCDCCCKNKLHKYKIRKLSTQSFSSKSVSSAESIDNRINWNLPFQINSNIHNYNDNNRQIFTIETDLEQDKIPNNRIKVKNRMDSYLYAIKFKDKILDHSSNIYQKNGNGYKFNLDSINSHDSKKAINNFENNSTDLNTDSPLTDLPSPPSSLNLVSLSRCPSPPAPLNVNPYLIRNDFASIASDETNQLKNLFYDKRGSDISEGTFCQRQFPNTKNSNIEHEVNFIKFYLDKFDSQFQVEKLSDNQSNNQISEAAKDYITNQNIKILNEYLSHSNTEEIIESTIELIKNFKHDN